MEFKKQNFVKQKRIYKHGGVSVILATHKSVCAGLKKDMLFAVKELSINDFEKDDHEDQERWAAFKNEYIMSLQVNGHPFFINIYGFYEYMTKDIKSHAIIMEPAHCDLFSQLQDHIQNG